MIWWYRISLVWLVGAVLLLLAYFTRWIPYWQAGAYGGLVILCSLLAFLLNGLDKWQSRRAGRRVPERWLHALELAGGWPGAFFGQELFRHKTFKPSYRRVFWLMIFAHILLLGLALYFSQTQAPPRQSVAASSRRGVPRSVGHGIGG